MASPLSVLDSIVYVFEILALQKLPRIVKNQGRSVIKFHSFIILLFLCLSLGSESREKLSSLWWLFVGIHTSVAFLVLGDDKRRSENDQFRIPELTIYLFCALFGFFGTVLAMIDCRHKTRKSSFIIFTLALGLLNVHLYRLIWTLMLNCLELKLYIVDFYEFPTILYF